jgi:phage terminase small subunit
MTFDEKIKIAKAKKPIVETVGMASELKTPTNLNEKALMIYLEKIDPLVAEGIVTVDTVEIFAIYCQLLAEVQQIGIEIDNMDGGHDLGRLRAYRLKLIEKVMEYAKRFGFTPTDRGRVVKSVADKAVNEFAEFVGNGN